MLLLTVSVKSLPLARVTMIGAPKQIIHYLGIMDLCIPTMQPLKLTLMASHLATGTSNFKTIWTSAIFCANHENNNKGRWEPLYFFGSHPRTFLRQRKRAKEWGIMRYTPPPSITPSLIIIIWQVVKNLAQTCNRLSNFCVARTHNFETPSDARPSGDKSLATASPLALQLPFFACK